MNKKRIYSGHIKIMATVAIGIACTLSGCGGIESAFNSSSQNASSSSNQNPSDSSSNNNSGNTPDRYYTIPKAAFTNALGNFPAVADCSNSLPPGTIQPLPVVAPNTAPCPVGNSGTSAFQYNQPAAQPGLGVPLGGVGAGSFMINQAGSFGPWDFGGTNQNQGGSLTQFEDRILPQAAFHIQEQVGDAAPTTTTLVVNAAPWNQLPSAWNTLKVGDGDYSALWPFGWATYKPFATGVSMKFWSPIIAGNDQMTSMPVAYFDVRLANTTNKTNRVTVMFTFPNAPDHVPFTVRKGLTSQYQQDTNTGVSGVTLSSSDPQNTPDAKDSDWTIAVKPSSGQVVSYVTSWNASGNGTDIYGALSPNGLLPNKALDASSSAGAIAVTVTLQPGQVSIIPFMLAWDFPQTTVPAAGTCGTAGPCETWSNDPNLYWMRRYTSFFGGKETATNDYIKGTYPSHQGFTIANTLLPQHDSAMAQVEGWWKKIVNEPSYPEWLVRLALNEEIQMVFNESFWESGMITDTPSTTARIGSAIPDTHLFCTSTGGNWNTCNEWDTDAWGYLAEVLLWPNVERDRLRGVVQEKYQDIRGVGDTGVTENPVTNALEPTTGRFQFTDVPLATIFRCYTYYRRTGDKDFFKYAYPAMLKEMQLVQKQIHLPVEHLPLDLPGQEDSYDAWVAEVHNIYNSGLWLLTEEIMIDATEQARALGVSEATLSIEQQLQSDLPLAKQEFETVFWDPVTGHYKIDPVGQYLDGYFIDTFFAQQIAYTLGLPPLVPIEHEVQHLLQAYPQQMQASFNGHMTGPPNMVPLAGPMATTMLPIEQEEIWPGSAMEYAGTFLQAAQVSKNQTLADEGLTIAHVLEYWMVEAVSQGFLFEEPGGWDWNTPGVYRSPSFSQERTTLGVLNTIKPIIDWAIPPPPASLYGGN